MAKTTDTSSNYRWSDSERQFLLDHTDLSGKELVAAFRAEHPKVPVSNQAIIGRRYRLIHSSTDPMQRVKALEARIASTREKLADLEDDLAEARAALGPDYTAMTMTDLRKAVADAGVTPDGRTKQAFIDALEAAPIAAPAVAIYPD